MKKYRKKPVVIEAMQWTGDNSILISEFLGNHHYSFRNGSQLYIITLEGEHFAAINDWIIKGIKGEFYPCKPDIFEQTYEEVIS